MTSITHLPRRALALVVALLLMLAAGLAVAGPAAAEQDTTVCVPADAYPETTDWLTEMPEGDGWEVIDTKTVIDKEAVPEDSIHRYRQWVEPTTKEIPNTDYVPESTIEHEAEFKTVWKYTMHGGNDFIWLDNDTWKYVDSDGNGSNEKPGKDVTYYERTQHTTQEKVKDAWTETVPAQGEPTITVEDVPGHWYEKWFPTLEEREGWEFMRTKIKVEGSAAVTHVERKYTRTIPAVVCPQPEPVCTANLFDGFEDRGGLWEITYGMQHTDTNGVPTFTNDSFGGLVAFNEGDIPGYMGAPDSGYRWLYVYGDTPGKVWLWDFADTTRVTASVQYSEEGCPIMTWATGTTPTDPPTEDPTTEPTPDPTPDPTTDPAPDPTPDPTTEPTAEPEPTNDPTTQPVQQRTVTGDRLAETGADDGSGTAAGIAGLLTLAGAALMAIRRRLATRA